LSKIFAAKLLEVSHLLEIPTVHSRTEMTMPGRPRLQRSPLPPDQAAGLVLEPDIAKKGDEKTQN